MSAEEQIESLANFIMSDEVPGWPNASEGAGDAAIRLIRELQRQAKFLFQLLDDIDTVDDQAKGNYIAYRRMVKAIHPRRFEVATTDGYEVTLHASELERCDPS